MKRTFAKQRLMSLLAGFFLFVCLVFTAGSAAAQQVNWMQSDQAKQVLVNEVNAVVLDIPNLQGPAQQDAIVHAIFYKSIVVFLEGGMPTGEAVAQALSALDGNKGAGNHLSRTAPSPDVTMVVDKNTLGILYQDAEDLLTL